MGSAMPSEVQQRVAEALVAVLDMLPAIAALTGRASGNVIPFEDGSPPALPGVCYLVYPATQMGTGWRVPVGFAAVAGAGEEALCNALLAEVARGADARAFIALAPPLDAVALTAIPQTVPAEPETSRRDQTIPLLVWM